MKNTKYWVLALLAIAFVNCQSSPETNAKEAAVARNGIFQQTSLASEYPANITLKGSVAAAPEGTEIILYKIVNNDKQEAGRVTTSSKGAFTYNLKVEQPIFALFSVVGKGDHFFIMNHENLELTLDAENNFAATGSKENELLAKFQEVNGKLNEEGSEMQQKLASAADREKAYEEYGAFVEKAVSTLKNFIKENDTPFASLLITGAFDMDQEYEFLLETSEKLQKKYPGVPEVEQLAGKVNAARATAVGQKAPEISLQSPEGKVIKLSSLKGKYVLLDFWASWCGPCRQENPNVVRMYDRFKNKKFEIYSVSLDRDREKWLQAIEKDKLDWVHVSDLKFWQSEAARAYSVSSIPMTFLLDPEGNIIAKNLRGKALEKKLEEIL